MLSTTWRDLPAAAKAAVVLAVAGFVIRATVESSATSSGLVTECSYRDYGALVLGAAAAVAGIISLVQASDEPRRALVLSVGVLALVVGSFHVARGLGVFHDCGPTARSSSIGDPSFDLDDATDRARDQLGDDDDDPSDGSPDDTPVDDGTTLDDEWSTTIGLASSHRDETLSLDLPEDWTLTSDGSGTPTRQQLPEAESADGSIKIVGYALALTSEEQDEFRQDAAAGDTVPAPVGAFDGWTLVDPRLTFTTHEYFVLVDDLFVKITFQVDNEDNDDPTSQIEAIIATLRLD